jgi:hypothetical protein
MVTNMITFNWTKVGHMSGRTCISVYRDERYKVQKEVHTRRINECDFGKPKFYFFVDGLKKEFRTEEALILHLTRTKDTRRDGSALDPAEGR